MTNTPLVSVHMITYMHENFIRQAIEGVLMQQTKFEFELIIADYCTPDKTPEIVNEIIKTHPKGYRIKYYRNRSNLGMIKNGLFAFSKCTGKYIAACEGDDYWTDPYKLQKQVEFLEANPEYLLVYTDFDSYNELRNNLISSNSNEAIIKKDGYIFEDLLIQNFIGTLTVVVRRSSILEAFDSIKQVNQAWKMGDYPLWLEISTKGKIGYLNHSTAVYRLSGNTVSNHSNYLKFLEFNLSAYTVRKYFINKYPSSVGTIKSINKWHNKLLLEYCFLTKNRNHLNKSEIKNAFNELRAGKLFIGYRFHLYYLGAIFKFFRPILKIVLKIFYPERLMSLRV